MKEVGRMQVLAMTKFSYPLDANASVRTYEWGAKIFHSDTACSSGGVHDIFHQTISFYAKA